MSLKGKEDKVPGTKFFIKYEQSYIECSNKDTIPGPFWIVYYVIL